MDGKPHRRWYQFSLRSLLVVMTLSSLVPGWWAVRETIKASRERARLEAAYAWFDTLGYPEVSGLEPIRITTTWPRYSGQPPQVSQESGFLVAKGERGFTAFTLDLTTRTYVPSSGDANVATFTFEPLELAKLANETLSASAEEDRDLHFEPDLSKRASLVVLGWACRKHGHAAVARELFYAAERTPHWNDDEASAKELADRVADDIAHAELWRAIVSFSDLSVSRAALRDKFRWLARHFPNSEHAARIQETAAMLEQMVEEDRLHEARLKESPPHDSLSTSEQIAELIFRLRDQNGHQWSQPGSCHVFDTVSEEKSPAHLLLDHGYDAVPQLVDALSDRRLTRSVGYHRNFYFSHNVLTVGNAALQVLTAIAGRRFEPPKMAGEKENIDDYTRALQDEVRTWYRELQRKGERQALIEAVAKGDDASANLARRLVEKYPLDAGPPILTAIANSPEGHVRDSLLELLGDLESDEPVPFLFHAMENGPNLSFRTDAAYVLWRRERPEALIAMLREWRKTPAQNGSDVGNVGFFLLKTGRIEGIAAVSERFAEQSVEVRVGLVDMIGGRLSEYSDSSSEFRAAAVDLLLLALKDEEVRSGLHRGFGTKSISEPRVCDLAGYYLNEIDPQRFEFDLNASLTKRDRARYAILAMDTSK